MAKSIAELEGRHRESKELYVYAEEKYENEKAMRAKVESSIKELNRRIHAL
jgi:hypothetical protein